MTKSEAEREAKRINRTYSLEAWHIPSWRQDVPRGSYVVYVAPFKGARGDLIRVIAPGWKAPAGVVTA